MTVKELIKKLKKFDENAVVCISELDYSNITKLPDDLKVGDDLYCTNNPLPKDTKKPTSVKGKMIL